MTPQKFYCSNESPQSFLTEIFGDLDHSKARTEYNPVEQKQVCLCLCTMLIS